MSAMARTGPAPLEDERSWVPPDIEAARWLYARATSEGVSPGQARGLVAWLITLPDSRADDPTTNTQRSRYRRILHRLGEPPWDRVRFGGKGAYSRSGGRTGRNHQGRRDRRSRVWPRGASFVPDRIAS